MSIKLGAVDDPLIHILQRIHDLPHKHTQMRTRYAKSGLWRGLVFVPDANTLTKKGGGPR